MNNYFNTYTEAVLYAYNKVKERYNVLFPEYLESKPSQGHTSKIHMEITNSKKELHIQVYNRGTDYNTFELNYYLA